MTVRPYPQLLPVYVAAPRLCWQKGGYLTIVLALLLPFLKLLFDRCFGKQKQHQQQQYISNNKS